MIVRKDFSLAGLNTFRIDAIARCLVVLSDDNDIAELLSSQDLFLENRIILGGGSNVLFTGDFDGCIIKPEIKGIEVLPAGGEFVHVRAGAGESWDDLVKYCVENGYGGIENLSFIPGTVGASPVQNIGAYGTEVKETIHSVEYTEISTGKKVILGNNDCGFSYRNSVFKGDLKNKVIITNVTFRLSKNPVPRMSYSELRNEMAKYPSPGIREIRSAVISIRKRKLPDPVVLPNAGSFFKNPYVSRATISQLRDQYENIPFFEDTEGNIKLSAAWLIDKCGLRGKRVNDTGTHEGQPLVIVNYGRATGSEILSFAAGIKEAVSGKFGVKLETEVNIIGPPL